MLREISFRVKESYVLCSYDLLFSFAKQEEDGKLSPLFFDVKLDSTFSYQYYGSGPYIYVFVFKITRSYDPNDFSYLVFEYSQSTRSDDIWFQMDLPVGVSVKVKNLLGIGSGEFKYFPTEDKLQRYYILCPIIENHKIVYFFLHIFYFFL